MCATNYGICIRQSNSLTVETCEVVAVISVFTETLALSTGQVFPWTALITPITRLQKFKT